MSPFKASVVEIAAGAYRPQNGLGVGDMKEYSRLYKMIFAATMPLQYDDAYRQSLPSYDTRDNKRHTMIFQ